MENLTQPNRDGLEVQPAELKAAMRAADTNGKDKATRQRFLRLIRNIHYVI